ncbi:MAG: sulfite exporter TauE/SafE family protein [Patescibacteria group bacterium]
MYSKKSSKKKTTICVKGMYCQSCDILVTDRLKSISGIADVHADYRTQEVEIVHNGDINHNILQQQLEEFGYQIMDKETYEEVREPFWKRITDAVVLTMILLILFLMAQEFNLVPEIDTTGTLSLATVLVIGILASLSTCMATTGALFLSTIGRIHDASQPLRQRLTPALGFNVGRIVTYSFMGLVNGAVGQLLAHDLQMETSLNIIVGILMVFVGLDMLRIFSFSSLLPTGFMKRQFLRLEHTLLRRPKQTSFLLGASTYWLPCGFSQSVQLYALAVADPIQSMLVMLVFVLGTTPALMGVAFASNMLKSSFYGGFMKLIGVFVFLVGSWYVLSYLALYNIAPIQQVSAFLYGDSVKTVVAVNETSSAEQVDGSQIIRMTVSNDGYAPNDFTVKRGIPVRWIIEGKEIFGCQGILQAPQIGVSRVLEQGENIVEFTPENVGDIAFSCSAGSVGGKIHVIDS